MRRRVGQRHWQGRLCHEGLAQPTGSSGCSSSAKKACPTDYRALCTAGVQVHLQAELRQRSRHAQSWQVCAAQHTSEP